MLAAAFLVHLHANLIFGGDKAKSFGRKHGVKDALEDAAAVPHEFKLREHHQNEAAEEADSNSQIVAGGFESSGLTPNTFGPVAYNLHGFLNWTTAHNFCTKREGRLCTQKELCPNGPLQPPTVPSPDGDLFVATEREPGSKQMDCANKNPDQGGENAKSTNSWLSLGTMLKEERLCKHHHEFAGCPHWGEIANRDMAGLKIKTYCCGDQVVPAERKQWCFNTKTDDDMMLSHVDVWPDAEKGKPKIFWLVQY